MANGKKNSEKNGRYDITPNAGKKFALPNIMLFIVLFLYTFIFVYGYWIVKNERFLYITFIDYLTGPVFTPKAYTLIQTFSDFDRQLGELRYSVISALFISGIAQSFLPKYSFYQTGEDSHPNNTGRTATPGDEDKSNVILHDIDRKIKIAGACLFIWFIIIVSGSYLGWGFSWKELDDRNIFFSDFYPQYFTTKFPALIFLFITAPAVYFTVRRHLYSQRVVNPLGRIYIILSLFFFTLLTLIYPIYGAEYLFSNESLMAIIQQYFTIISGVAMILKINSKKINLNEPPARFRLLYTYKRFPKESRSAYIWTFSGLLYFGILGYFFISRSTWVSIAPGYFLLQIPNILQTLLFTYIFFQIANRSLLKSKSKLAASKSDPLNRDNPGDRPEKHEESRRDNA